MLPEVEELVLLDVDPVDPPVVEVVVDVDPPVVVVVDPPVVVVVEPPVVVELCGLSGLPPVLVLPPEEDELDDEDELDEDELDPPDVEVEPPEVEVEPPEVEDDVDPPEVVVETTTLPPLEPPPPKKPPKKPPPKPPPPPPPITTGVLPPPPLTIGCGGGGGTYCGTAAIATSGCSQQAGFSMTRRMRLILRGAWRTTRLTGWRFTCLTCLILRYSVVAAWGSAT